MLLELLVRFLTNLLGRISTRSSQQKDVASTNLERY